MEVAYFIIKMTVIPVKWEYRVNLFHYDPFSPLLNFWDWAKRNASHHPALETSLKQWGKEGWEIISLMPIEKKETFYVMVTAKRQLTQSD